MYYNDLGCNYKEPYGIFPERLDYLQPKFKLYTQVLSYKGNTSHIVTIFFSLMCMFRFFFTFVLPRCVLTAFFFLEFPKYSRHDILL